MLPNGIHKRPSGALFFRRVINGRKFEWSFGHDCIDAAKCEVALFYRDPDAFMAQRIMQKRSATRMSDAIAKHLQWSERVKRTSPRYREGLARTLKRLEEVGPSHLGGWGLAHLEHYVASRRASSSTIATDVKHLKAFWSWAVAQGMIASSPASQLRGPKAISGSTDRRRVITLDTLLRLRFEVEGARDRVLALWATGLRVSELERVRLVDVRPDALHVRCTSTEQTKGKKSRDVPISDQSTRRVLLRVAGSAVRPDPADVARDLDQAIARAGVERFTPGALRHARITLWVDAGIPLPTVQAWAGHASIETTMNYTHCAPFVPPVALEGAL